MGLKLKEQQEAKQLTVEDLKPGDVFKFLGGIRIWIRSNLDISIRGCAVALDDGAAHDYWDQEYVSQPITLIPKGSTLEVE